MGQGQTQLGIITLAPLTDTLEESQSRTYPLDVSLATEVTIFCQSDSANPGESKVELLTAFRAGSFTEDLVIDVFDGIATPANFDQGDAFALMFLLPGGQNRKLKQYDASAAPGSKWTTTNETSNVEFPLEYIDIKITTDTDVGSYAHLVQALIRG